ncbi:DNA-binding response regulator [Galactobacter valiniphilus]|uniref:DNA-binding response regulator n=1 Tax=Galactobacter valiniphilus TaxID=2676122 RepID=A0A399J7D3_9MICC|nr:response regulator transcription factor [Galactobacter valiniphilus]RII41214.1 DNA-binding response regulator [Galactobacter valiniphilus]
MISVLVVDDEEPAVRELAYLLSRDERVGEVFTAHSAEAAFRELQENAVDLVLLDIHMPGLSGLETASILQRFAHPPALVFVTADESHAIQAYELAAVDYLLKPVRPARLSEAVRRVADAREASPHEAREAPAPAHPATGSQAVPASPAAASAPAPGGAEAPEGAAEPTVVVVQGESSVRIQLREITHVTAAGDYARLHTARGSFLERTPLSALEARWAGAGFVRIHRSALVRVDAIEAVTRVDGAPVVRVAGVTLPVARRALARVRASFGLNALASERQ